MLRFFIACMAVAMSASVSCAQVHTINGTVRDAETQEPIPGATVLLMNTTLGSYTTAEGNFTVKNVAPGSYTLRASFIGYAPFETVIRIAGDTALPPILLSQEETETEEVVVTATRTARTISDVPIRIEVVPQEEIEEKLLMRASSVAMILNESTGMRMQTTSATSNAANIRIQGLQGRYTQILQDGIPNFGGMSSGFGLMQMLPLNLRQVEVVKGSASVLYGADAISGVVNFITKDPVSTAPELSSIINATSQQGLDLSAYYGQKYTDNLGMTLLASYNRQAIFDIDGDRFSDLPRFDRITLAPKFVWNSNNDLQTSLHLNFLSEDRFGGSMQADRNNAGQPGPYSEQNTTKRYSAALRSTWAINEEHSLAMNLAGLRLDRDAFYGTTVFDASQYQGYADLQYRLNFLAHGEPHDLLFGAAVNYDNFRDRTPGINPRSYLYATAGIFAQFDERFSDTWELVASGRLDHNNHYGLFFTPRLSLMFRPEKALTFRIGGGSGYKLPTIFIEEAEKTGYRGIGSVLNLKAERAQNLQLDMNYRTIVGEVTANFNTAVYATLLRDALVAAQDTAGAVSIMNASGATFTRGAEVSGQFTYDDFKLSLGYTFIYADQEHNGQRYEMALNPRHSAGIILFYESDELGLKAGLENYYTSTQRLDGNPFRERSPNYWITGAMVEKAFGSFRVFVNFENIFDTRHTRFDPLYTGNPAAGDLRLLDVYAPLEGRVINGGIRVVL